MIRLPVADAAARRVVLLRSTPRLRARVRVAGARFLGLGLVDNPTGVVIPAYLALGVVVGILAVWADRSARMAVILPVVASLVVTWLSFNGCNTRGCVPNARRRGPGGRAQDSAGSPVSGESAGLSCATPRRGVRGGCRVYPAHLP